MKSEIIIALTSVVVGALASHGIYFLIEKKKRKRLRKDFADTLLSELNFIFPKILETYFNTIYLTFLRYNTIGSKSERGNHISDSKERLKYLQKIISKFPSQKLNELKDKVKEALEENNMDTFSDINLSTAHNYSLSKINLSLLNELSSSFTLIEKEIFEELLHIRNETKNLNLAIKIVNKHISNILQGKYRESIDRNIRNIVF